MVNTADIIPYARNSRTHSEAQVGKIAASIKEFGFLNPIIVDGSNGIVAGHGRILAAQKLGSDQEEQRQCSTDPHAPIPTGLT
jgi:ParB-like chromosome segregation protein Spo0J